MTEPFKTQKELDVYFSGDTIECLECGKFFKNLGRHLRHSHDISPDEYRVKWGIPKKYGLAGAATKKLLSSQMVEMRKQKIITNDHLPDAAKKINYKRRQPKTPINHRQQVERIKTAAPWGKSQLPPGSKRKGGRDADRARLYQRAYRALKQGNSALMEQYCEEYK